MRFMPSFLKLREQSEQAISSLPNIMIHAEKLAASVVQGEHVRRKAGTGEKFWQYREYVQGDRPQDIDWRQSAKTDQVFIKQKEWQITRKTFLWCNTSASMDFKSDDAEYSKIDYARIITISLALLLQKNKEQIGVLGQTQTGRSDKIIEAIGLSLFEDQNNTLQNKDINALENDAYLMAVGDFLDPLEDMKQVFDTIAQKTENALIVHVLDPAETEMPYEGRIEFSDSMNNNKNLINHVATIRNEYKKRIELHCTKLEKLCRSKGWTYVLCTTAQSPLDTLQNIYSILENNGRA